MNMEMYTEMRFMQSKLIEADRNRETITIIISPFPRQYAARKLPPGETNHNPNSKQSNEEKNTGITALSLAQCHCVIAPLRVYCYPVVFVVAFRCSDRFKLVQINPGPKGISQEARH